MRKCECGCGEAPARKQSRFKKGHWARTPEGRAHCARLGSSSRGSPLGYENRSTKNATKSPTPRDLEWAAGFLEGEGHFRRASNGATGSEMVRGYQVDKEPMERLLAMFGGSLKLKTRNAPQNDIWIWGVYGSRARGVMGTLFVLLSERRQEQIRAALAGTSA